MSDFYFLPDETPNPDSGNKQRLHGQKPPLKPRQVWAIRTRLEIQAKRRDLALLNLAIDSKLRSCDLVALRDSDLVTGDSVRDRAVIVQQTAENRSLGPLRAHGADARGSACLARATTSKCRRVCVSEPCPWLYAPLNSAVCADRESVGGQYRA